MRFRTPLAAALAALLAVAAATGCTGTQAPPVDKPAEVVRPVRIGTLPTEDALPLWVAEQQGVFAKVGLDDVEIVTFQAAQERDTAFTSGAIDAFMGDLIAAANLEHAGTSVTVATVMLGSTPAEGRFGIVSAPKSGITTLSALAGVPIGTSSDTIQEYVLDGLMRQSGIPADKVKKEEVKKVPVRFDLLMAGKLKAAALPEPLLSLAIKQGATLVADDTKGENLSQTVLVFSDAFLRSEGGIETEAKVLDAWDMGVDAVDADPDSWRGLLVEKARLPEPIKDTYEVETYPKSDAPTAEQVDAVLAWMKGKGLLGKRPVTYESLVIVTP
ncbi:MAG: nitrate ABC transporter substrate-binding protein [Coriobacteriaceae bacterium]|nr:nitrate ABC transporter substrate-binding protein [Coriobacteriaceae bacterium]